MPERRSGGGGGGGGTLYTLGGDTLLRSKLSVRLYFGGCLLRDSSSQCIYIYMRKHANVDPGVSLPLELFGMAIAHAQLRGRFVAKRECR